MYFQEDPNKLKEEKSGEIHEIIFIEWNELIKIQNVWALLFSFWDILM